jgi:cobalt-zinc-cadmium efflux system protein
VLARTTPTERFTYGLRSVSILSALVNAILLLVVTGAIAWEAVSRLHDPGEVGGTTVMVVAAAGIVINGLSALLLGAGRHGDLNIRGAFLHLLADAAVSAGVVIAGALIVLTGQTWIDPATSLIVSVVIVWGTWKLLREAIDMSMDAVPAAISAREVRGYLESLPGVASIHDLHIWAMSTTENALTVHLVLPKGHPGDAYLIGICHELDYRFHIRHPTIQIEVQDAEVCHLEPAGSL